MNDIYQEKGLWKVHCWEDVLAEAGLGGGERWRDEICIGPAAGPDRLTKKMAQRIAWENFLSSLRRDESVAQKETSARSEMTITRFVETTFVPEHVLAKRLAGRLYYQAILKHVLPPEEVDRIFHVTRENSKAKLKVIPDWPYLGDLRIGDCGPEHIARLISAAHARGYSAQTVIHIRNVVSAIFSDAIRSRHYLHENPAKTAILPERPHRNPHLLTLTQAKEVLRAMRYPEKEMTLIAMLTGMNVAEICGLQWKHVNLTGITAGETIPPITIAVRKRWYRGELDNVNRTRARNLPIPELLLPILIKLSGRGRWTAPDDFVLVSRVGTPINAINITARRLKTIGNDLQMPWLTWDVFRRGHFALEAELGAQFNFLLASMFHSEAPQGPVSHGSWSQSSQLMRTGAP
jgi:integrase